ncbi:hypothetical protein ACNRBV_09475, partial [Ralstonia pseudosolanacearum]|uniref:hypothetical protein n=1 Tax=Ralstonia pseudosolanacearum TaxID=1310165 RepID=UPI003AB09DF3
PITGHKAEKIREAAKKLASEVKDVSAVRQIVGQPAFRDGLSQLSKFYPPQNVPVRTRKGNPERRVFIWAVAQAFYSHFRDFHIEAIHEIVALLWPNTDVRNVRHELTSERKAQIAEAAKAEIAAAGDAAVEATAVLTRVQRKVTPYSESVADYPSDNEQIRQALTLLTNLADKELAASLVQGLHSVLAEFDFELTNN